MSTEKLARRCGLWLLAPFFLGLGLLQTARADLERGLAAYDAGDLTGAAAEFAASAAQGDIEAMVALAGLYSAGTGVAQDHRAAALLYRKAAEQGSVIAQVNLGELYREGRGLPRDPLQARHWWELAAEQGNLWAKAALEELHAETAAEQ